jgi:hypothetical protein
MKYDENSEAVDDLICRLVRTEDQTRDDYVYTAAAFNAIRDAALEEASTEAHECWECGIPSQEFAARIRALTEAQALVRNLKGG